MKFTHVSRIMQQLLAHLQSCATSTTVKFQNTSIIHEGKVPPNPPSCPSRQICSCLWICPFRTFHCLAQFCSAVSMDTKLLSTEPWLLERHRVASCKPLLTCSSTHEDIHLYHVWLKTITSLVCAIDSSTLTHSHEHPSV